MTSFFAVLNSLAAWLGTILKPRSSFIEQQLTYERDTQAQLLQFERDRFNELIKFERDQFADREKLYRDRIRQLEKQVFEHQERILLIKGIPPTQLQMNQRPQVKENQLPWDAAADDSLKAYERDRERKRAEYEEMARQHSQRNGSVGSVQSTTTSSDTIFISTQ